MGLSSQAFYNIMATERLTDFTLPKRAYAAFDATSIKQLMEERLNDNSTFTGQNFEGSNLSSLLDVMAYSYHVLLFYLNQTGTEAMFTEAELYENMNRIVKALDYKPTGTQTSSVAFQATALSTLVEGTYTIPRYTTIDVGSVFYSFAADATFNKTTAIDEQLTQFSDNHLLFQGKYEEYPRVTMFGEDFETITLVPGGNVNIDHFNIDVYIKDVDTGNWEQWLRASSLFLESPTNRRYEVRLNENRRYEIKFGDGKTGRKVKTGDEVAVYYLKSDGASGEININALASGIVARYNTVQFREIFDKVKDVHINYTTQLHLDRLKFNNANPSSEYYVGESVENIRERAPKTFSSQHRLVTKGDYESYIEQTFSNFIKDATVVDNFEYVNGHLDYLINTLGLQDSSSRESRTVLNRVNFADACDFNNVYIYAVPRLEKIASTVVRTNYLAVAQKNTIISDLRSRKTLTSEPLIMDPVYMTVDVGLFDSVTETLTTAVTENTVLEVQRQVGSTRSLASIKNAVFSIISTFFSGMKLGDTIGVNSMVNDILNLEGVQSINTVRTDTGQRVKGLELLIWNPIYPVDDINTTGSDLVLPYFKYAYLNDPTNFADKISVVLDVPEVNVSES